ncbi:MAG: hypothetical protein V4471_07400 [Pseudomonadota bacterium]
MESVNDLKRRLNAEEVKLREAQQELEGLGNHLRGINDLVSRHDALADRDKASLKIVNNQQEQNKLFISLENNESKYQYYWRQSCEVKCNIQKKESAIQNINQEITSLTSQIEAISRESQQRPANSSFFNSSAQQSSFDSNRDMNFLIYRR